MDYEAFRCQIGEASKITELPTRQITHLIKEKALELSEPNPGQGVARNFNLQDLFVLAVARGLISLGMKLGTIRNTLTDRLGGEEVQISDDEFIIDGGEYPFDLKRFSDQEQKRYLIYVHPTPVDTFLFIDDLKWIGKLLEGGPYNTVTVIDLHRILMDIKERIDKLIGKSHITNDDSPL